MENLSVILEEVRKKYFPEKTKNEEQTIHEERNNKHFQMNFSLLG